MNTLDALAQQPERVVGKAEQRRHVGVRGSTTDMGKFLVSSRLNVPLQTHDWASFARGYNDSNYAVNRYDIRLNEEFQKYSAAGVPDLTVRAAQLYLRYLGFHSGPIDGVAGTRSRSALADFQAQHGLAKTSTIDSRMVAQ